MSVFKSSPEILRILRGLNAEVKLVRSAPKTGKTIFGVSVAGAPVRFMEEAALVKALEMPSAKAIETLKAGMAKYMPDMPSAVVKAPETAPKIPTTGMQEIKTFKPYETIKDKQRWFNDNPGEMQRMKSELHMDHLNDTDFTNYITGDNIDYRQLVGTGRKWGKLDKLISGQAKVAGMNQAQVMEAVRGITGKPYKSLAEVNSSQMDRLYKYIRAKNIKGDEEYVEMMLGKIPDAIKAGKSERSVARMFKGFFRSMTGIMKQTPSGAKMAELGNLRREHMGAELSKFYRLSLNPMKDLLKKATKRDLTNFTLAADGRIPIETLPESHRKALYLWQEFTNNIADWARRLNLTVKTSEGKEIPWTMIRKLRYFPHYYPRNLYKDNKWMNGVLQQLRKSASFADKTDSELRAFARKYMIGNREATFGHLEHAREFDMPGWVIDSPLGIMESYARRVVNRLTYAERFGPRGEMSRHLIGKAVAEGADEATLTAFDDFMAGRVDMKGRFLSPETSAQFSRFISNLKGYGYGLRLPFSWIPNMGQTELTAIKFAHHRVAKAVLQIPRKYRRKWAEEVGVVFEGAEYKYLEEIEQVHGKKFAEFVLNKLTPFKKIEEWNREVAAITGKIAAEDWFAALKAGKNVKLNRGRMAELLGETKLTEALKRGSMNISDLKTASFNAVQSTQFMPWGIEMPLWSNSLYGKVFFTLKTFPYQVSRFMYHSVYRQLMKGDFGPGVRLVVGGTIVGEVVRDFSDLIRHGPEGVKNRLSQLGEDPLPLSIGLRVVDNMVAIGTLGLLESAFYGLEFKDIVGQIAGAPVEHIGSIIEQVYAAVKDPLVDIGPYGAEHRETYVQRRLRPLAKKISPALEWLGRGGPLVPVGMEEGLLWKRPEISKRYRGPFLPKARVKRKRKRPHKVPGLKPRF